MNEVVSTRERELVESGICPPMAFAMAELDYREERARTGKVVIKQSEREWHSDRMSSRILYYLGESDPDSATMDWRIFIHEIGVQSGSHKHQGGIALFVLEGEGATVMDGQTIEWRKGDLILLPVKPDQVEHKHVSYTPRTRWIAFIYYPFWKAVASTMTQTEDRPDWRPPVKGTT